MSLVSSVASALFAALPQAVRCPAPRKSFGTRQFDVFMDQLFQAHPTQRGVPAKASLKLTRVPVDGPTRAVERRARN